MAACRHIAATGVRASVTVTERRTRRVFDGGRTVLRQRKWVQKQALPLAGGELASSGPTAPQDSTYGPGSEVDRLDRGAGSDVSVGQYVGAQATAVDQFTKDALGGEAFQM